MRFSLIIMILLLSGPLCFAQTFGYIDSEYILSQVPDYKLAEKEIEQLATSWEKEAEEMSTKIESMYRFLHVEQVLLTEEMKKERLDLIREEEDKLKEFQKKVFGFEGLLFLKKQELIKPIQDKLWTAADRVAKKNNLSMIFDKSGPFVIIYSDPRYDLTELVLDELGLVN